jgi:predicted SAM-dependent methyltransferase
VKLELGSGFAPAEGFTHLDLNPNAPFVDIVGSAYPLPDEVTAQEWDEIRAVDVLEHLSYRDTPNVLAGWAKVLAPDGRLFVQLPDAETIMRWFVQSPRRLMHGLPKDLPQTPLAGATWRLLGGHADGERVEDGGDFRFNAHYALFSKVSLCDALADAGLTVESCVTNPFPNLQCWARK